MFASFLSFLWKGHPIADRHLPQGVRLDVVGFAEGVSLLPSHWSTLNGMCHTSHHSDWPKSLPPGRPLRGLLLPHSRHSGRIFRRECGKETWPFRRVRSYSYLFKLEETLIWWSSLFGSGAWVVSHLPTRTRPSNPNLSRQSPPTYGEGGF